MASRKTVLVHTLQLHKKMVLLNAHHSGYWYFKNLSIVFMDTLCFNFTVASSNKNNKNMEKFWYFTKCRKLLKQLSKVLAIV